MKKQFNFYVIAVALAIGIATADLAAYHAGSRIGRGNRSHQDTSSYYDDSSDKKVNSFTVENRNDLLAAYEESFKARLKSEKDSLLWRFALKQKEKRDELAVLLDKLQRWGNPSGLDYLRTSYGEVVKGKSPHMQYNKYLSQIQSLCNVKMPTSLTIAEADIKDQVKFNAFATLAKDALDNNLKKEMKKLEDQIDAKNVEETNKFKMARLRLSGFSSRSEIQSDLGSYI